MHLLVKEISTMLNPADVYNIFKNEKNTILLDSLKEDNLLSKFSFIGINPFLVFESKGEKAFVNEELVEGNPFEVLESLINKYNYEVEEEYNEIPFLSGAIGYISYDTGRILEELPNESYEDFDLKDMKFILYRNLIIFDLINNKQYITALCHNEKKDINDEEEPKSVEIGIEKNIGEEESEADRLLNEIEEIRQKILNGKYIDKKLINERHKDFKSNFTKEEYKNAVKTLKDYIVSGDVYIANMTQRFFCESTEDSYDTYIKLRQINKAPFAAYMNFEDFQVISSSPERFIQIKDRLVHTRPIKGTRPRGVTEEEDIKNREELLNSEKDKAELLMVVDLERNDLSKVCKPHSVKVTELFKLEEYATVFHLVSTIEGKLKDEVSSVKCIKECFPGGSITGTPKIRAMEIIEELEKLKRNLYTGSIGYFDFRGNADFNIVIRTIIKKDNKAYFGVGGGITYDSIEEDEYNETLDKAKALMRVL